MTVDTSPQDRLRELQTRIDIRQAEMKLALMENSLSVYDDYKIVDRSLDDVNDRDEWIPIGFGDDRKRIPFNTEEGLAEIRNRSRTICMMNPYAINLVENRVSYIVGDGLNISAINKDEEDTTDLDDVDTTLDDFRKMQDFDELEQEVVRRADRDGEVFLRRFPMPDGTTEIRFVEPGDVSTPIEHREKGKPYDYGILVDPEDHEKRLGYFINKEFVPAEFITHIKLNVDRNVKRGIPTTFAVHDNLKRADKLLRNMSVVATMQAAISMIRQHDSSSNTSVRSFVNEQADATLYNQNNGQTTNYQALGDPRIIDAPSGVKYDFPAVGMNIAQFIEVLKAELRAIAARVVMPEFMLSSDASNANYSSTMVAEGPSVRNFSRLQNFFKSRMIELYERVVMHAIESKLIDLSLADGIMSREVLAEVMTIEATSPTLAVRNRKEEIDANMVMVASKVMSVQTASELDGLDYEKEQQNIDEHTERVMERMPDLPLPGEGGDPNNPFATEPKDDDEGDDDNEKGDKE